MVSNTPISLTPPQKLYINSATEFCSQVCIAVAHEAGHQVEVVVASAEIQAAKDFKLKNITGELPMLETPEGTITEQITIIKFLARKVYAKNLLGSNSLERAQVE